MVANLLQAAIAGGRNPREVGDKRRGCEENMSALCNVPDFDKIAARIMINYRGMGHQQDLIVRELRKAYRLGHTHGWNERHSLIADILKPDKKQFSGRHG